ncbi:hypothetical protein [Nocardia sp. XZ_19_385]|uniref:hypothetical protein n=1 Tax=Nocardia sp. XZ_19_385 TaxID=2769488 RepID=UPI001890B3DE|nr:hypothetical protein [Nocardia sp. XZ_19_385]
MTTPNPLLDQLGEPAEVLTLLTPSESQRLSDLLRQAKRSEQRSLDETIDRALTVLPRLMRMPARKILFGK